MEKRTLSRAFLVNGKKIHLKPTFRTKPVVICCIDGLDPAYLVAAERHRKIPFMSQWKRFGYYTTVRSMMPSFTNPNNMSIITGMFPHEHGISGNYYYDAEAKEERMMNDASYLRCEETFLSRFFENGYKVGVVTAKRKLLSMLSHKVTIDPQNPNHPILVSVEGGDDADWVNNGISQLGRIIGDVPDIYSGDASLYVLKTGVYIQSDLFRRRDLLYLSTSDYIFHKYAPDEPEALEYMKGIDVAMAKLAKIGCIVGITADHGMNAKPGGIVFLRDVIKKMGEGSSNSGSSTSSSSSDAVADVATTGVRVVLPITDPYVRHHASLGSYATLYLESDAAKNLKNKIMTTLQNTTGILRALTREEACEVYGLPTDRVGDIVVVAQKDFVCGIAAEEHDLSLLGDRPLRTHGGESETMVPFLLNQRLEYGREPPKFNHDIMEYALCYMN